jgi:uncharacterized RDD family membrane protein YckC
MEESENYEITLPQEEVEIEKAPLWKRAVAYIIDLAVYYFIFFQIFMMIYIAATGIPFSEDFTAVQNYMAVNPELSMKMFTGLVGTTFVFLFYFVLTERVLGGSFGEMIMKFKVVAVNGEGISYWQAFLRNLTKSIFIPLLIFDLVTMFWTKEHQRVTEIISGTKVIYSPKLELVYEVYE